MKINFKRMMTIFVIFGLVSICTFSCNSEKSDLPIAVKKTHAVVVYYVNNAFDTIRYTSAKEELKFYISGGGAGPIILETFEDSILSAYVSHYKIIQ